MSALLGVFSTPFYKWVGIGLLALALAVSVWAILSKRAKRGKGTTGKTGTEKTEAKFPCLIADKKKRTIEVEETEISKIRESGAGRQWDYKGKEVYWLFRDKDDKYDPIVPPETYDNPPTLLHNALQQDAEDIVFDVTKEHDFIKEYSPYLLMIGLEIIALIFTSPK
jgi:hypothetical protein